MYACVRACVRVCARAVKYMSDVVYLQVEREGQAGEKGGWERTGRRYRYRRQLSAPQRERMRDAYNSPVTGTTYLPSINVPRSSVARLPNTPPPPPPLLHSPLPSSLLYPPCGVAAPPRISPQTWLWVRLPGYRVNTTNPGRVQTVHLIVDAFCVVLLASR